MSRTVFRGNEFKRRGRKYWHRCSCQLEKTLEGSYGLVTPRSCEARVYLTVSALAGREEYRCEGCLRYFSPEDLRQGGRVEILEQEGQFTFRYSDGGRR